MLELDQSPFQKETSGVANEVASLAEKARQGDRIAFAQLVDQFQEQVFRMVYYRTRSRMDAEDITQEIFLQALKNLTNLNDVTRFRSWLFGIAVNRVRDFHRKKRLLSLLGLSDEREDIEQIDLEDRERPNPLDLMLRREFWHHVRQLSKQLSRWEREVFYLRFFDQLSLKEISQTLSKSESAVKTHLYRALKKFKADQTFLEKLRGGTQ